MSYHEEDYLAFGAAKTASDEASVDEDNLALNHVPMLQWWHVNEEGKIKGYALGINGSKLVSFMLDPTIDWSTLQEGSWVLSTYNAYRLGVPRSPEPSDSEGTDLAEHLSLTQEAVRRQIVKFTALGGQDPDSTFHPALTRQSDILAASLEVIRLRGLWGFDCDSPHLENYITAIGNLERASAVLSTVKLCSSVSRIQKRLMDAVEKAFEEVLKEKKKAVTEKEKMLEEKSVMLKEQAAQNIDLILQVSRKGIMESNDEGQIKFFLEKLNTLGPKLGITEADIGELENLAALTISKLDNPAATSEHNPSPTLENNDEHDLAVNNSDQLHDEGTTSAMIDKGWTVVKSRHSSKQNLKKDN